ncbi:hypothetical protein BDV18DRAFT_155445 [Aspergillus unguis]
MGQGANCAIEDAAVLSTLLEELSKSTSSDSSSQAELETCLARFREQRYARSEAVYRQTMFGIRLYTRDGLVKRLIGRYIMPRDTDHMADMVSAVMADGPVVGFLPLPDRLGTGWEDYRSKGRRERALNKSVIPSV